MDDSGFTSLAARRVAIVGLGLMGGSLALALAGHCREIIGVETDSAARTFARDRAFVQRTLDFEPAVQSADLLVLATPVRTILDQLNQLTAARFASRCVVLDLGSTKSTVLSAMRRLPAHFDPIGGHPMCGKESGGIAHADAALYRDKTFVLCPLERTSAPALALAHELVAAIGARPLALDAGQHDTLAALVSHLPYVIAGALMRTALAAREETLWQLAASGFRDTSRLAASDLTMMIDILLTNGPAVCETLARYCAELDTLRAAIESGDPAALRAALEAGQIKRTELFK